MEWSLTVFLCILTLHISSIKISCSTKAKSKNRTGSKPEKNMYEGIIILSQNYKPI